MSDKLLKQFLADAEEAGITHLAPTQADRLAEQIKRALAAYEIPAHVQSSVSEDLAALAALAKQQASPDAQEQQQWSVSGDGRVLIANSFQHDVKLTLDGDFETAKQRIAYADDIARRLATPPSAPQAAVAAWRQVPIRPTEAMLDAGSSAGDGHDWAGIKEKT